MLSVFRLGFRSTVHLALSVVILSMPLWAQPIQAQQFLVGAVLTSNTSTGADRTGGIYQYSTNSGTHFDPLILTLNGATYGTGISIPLSTGNNVFTFTDGGESPGSFGGLELFLNSTGVSYNPVSGGRAGDLDVACDTAAANPFFVPVNGTQVADYSNRSGTLAYSGAGTANIGGQTVSVTAFSDNISAQGGFTLNVAAVTIATPEPGTWALLGGLSISGLALMRRRRQRKGVLVGRS